MRDRKKADPAEGVAEEETPPPSSRSTRLPAFAIGSVVAGKYRVEGEIGSGGIGVVVRAKHLQLDQLMAIKYLKPAPVSMPGVVERFIREARLAAKLTSDHVVKVHDVDTLDNGTPYMVMEYLEGCDLADMIANGPIEIQDAVGYVLQVSEALAEAHATGIVHRDLKPENLFLTKRPGGASVVKILDFGISKVIARGQRAKPERTERRPTPARADKLVTQPNDRFGTPAYMSPEQLGSSVSVDARSDIWALGVVLYELVTGVLPFEAKDMLDLYKAILLQPPAPLGDLRPDAPPELEAILERCLEKDREKRYRNVAELAQDLTHLRSEETRPRMKHIARVIRAAGESVRPPTPFPGTIPKSLLGLPKGESTPRARSAAAQETVRVRPPKGRWRARLLWLVVLVGATGFAAYAALGPEVAERFVARVRELITAGRAAHDAQ